MAFVIGDEGDAAQGAPGVQIISCWADEEPIAPGGLGIHLVEQISIRTFDRVDSSHRHAVPFGQANVVARLRLHRGQQRLVAAL